jgi:uncharacterized membrane protein YcaP (DUF421 family)
VDYAILENDGKLSVIKKQEQQPATKSDMKINTSPKQFISFEIIVDGNIISKNLQKLI